MGTRGVSYPVEVKEEAVRLRMAGVNYPYNPQISCVGDSSVSGRDMNGNFLHKKSYPLKAAYSATIF